ncbi:hypothetical protein BDZ85DRAFT_235857 [Elsinoe ampelina]|uniref:methionyl-tRNA formyltransferase n=1 Tax=Elsinoe ampelina TaxID=302913 RepID=A0A6A6GDW1_9PEZI|nr:hypothetical protein BDZ85DRAFT_235857 [Elsinoe ampelina]
MIFRTCLYVRRQACYQWTQRRWQTGGVPSLVVERPKIPPLKILFCGSDEFSIYSLFALCKLPSSVVESIDVVCKTGARVGRGLKDIRHPLIKDAAEQIHLPVHQISTFTSWTPPRPVDLVIAVSFGLLVPPRILSLATYGGLNVHPSFLPDLYGPAPIHWAMLHSDKYSGVTLQTLHPTKFDQGDIVDQTPRPGVELAYSIDRKTNKSALFRNVDRLGLAGAEMLKENLESGAFLTRRIESTIEGEVRHARKINKEDRRIKIHEWTAEELLRRDAVLALLWDRSTYGDLKRAETFVLGKEWDRDPAGRTRLSQWEDLTELVMSARKGKGGDRNAWFTRIELKNDEPGGSPITEFAATDSPSDHGADTLDDAPSVSEPQTKQRGAFLLRRGTADWVLVFRTKDGRYVGPAYARYSSKATVPINVFVGSLVSAVTQQRRKAKELEQGFKKWRLPSPEARPQSPPIAPTDGPTQTESSTDVSSMPTTPPTPQPPYAPASRNDSPASSSSSSPDAPTSTPPSPPKPTPPRPSTSSILADMRAKALRRHENKVASERDQGSNPRAPTPTPTTTPKVQKQDQGQRREGDEGFTIRKHKSPDKVRYEVQTEERVHAREVHVRDKARAEAEDNGFRIRRHKVM